VEGGGVGGGTAFLCACVEQKAAGEWEKKCQEGEREEVGEREQLLLHIFGGGFPPSSCFSHTQSYTHTNTLKLCLCVWQCVLRSRRTANVAKGCQTPTCCVLFLTVLNCCCLSSYRYECRVTDTFVSHTQIHHRYWYRIQLQLQILSNAFVIPWQEDIICKVFKRCAIN